MIVQNICALPHMKITYLYCIDLRLARDFLWPKD